ncbi:hypothetical protein ACS5NO_31735 [Larkinella sp. GY13]|uniref:hypothetical protein n=1 Tax=Larkinella sp. GY13 TaxID=3453720 RepID=UPI003EECDB7E
METFAWRPNLQRIVDLFLFSCYTGLHYDDVQTLKANEIVDGIDGREWLMKARVKYTDSDFFGERIQCVPLHPKAKILIEKYAGVENLPKISNDKYNDYLKQVQYLAEIRINLSVKIGRKTLTDILLNALNASEEAVAAMLGHSSTRFVKYYGRADERRIASEVKG